MAQRDMHRRVPVANEDSQASTRSAPAVLSIANGMTLAAVAGLPTVAILLRAIFLARGDLLVATTLIASLNLTAFLLSTFYLLMQFGLLSVFVVFYRNAIEHYQGREAAVARLPNGLYLALFGILALAAIATTTIWWGTSVFLAFGVLLCRVGFTSESADSRVIKAVRRAAPGHFLGIFCILGMFVPITAFPVLEAIATVPYGKGWAYVVSVDDRFTAILLPNGGVARVTNDQVLQREACPERIMRPPFQHDSLLSIALAGDGAFVPQLCREMPSLPTWR